MTKDQADTMAVKLNANAKDGLSYKAVHCPENKGRSIVQVYRDGQLIETL